LVLLPGLSILSGSGANTDRKGGKKGCSTIQRETALPGAWIAEFDFGRSFYYLVDGNDIVN
jgi:hypothetical protein